MEKKVYEVHIQNEICDVLTKLGYICWKNYDQGSRVNGRYRKDKWQRSGQADIAVLLPFNFGGIAWVEVKRPGGKQSNNQKLFERDIVLMGGHYKVVYSAVEAVRYLRGIYRPCLKRD